MGTPSIKWALPERMRIKNYSPKPGESFLTAPLRVSPFPPLTLDLNVNYHQFLKAKQRVVLASGFDPNHFTAALFPFQRDIVTMACRVGKFCIWADCGMGKTAMQLEWAAQVCQHTGGNVLILAPLAVSHQTVREGSKFGIDCRFASTQSEVQPGITVTNYEKLTHFDTASFQGVVLDESSILKA